MSAAPVSRRLMFSLTPPEDLGRHRHPFHNLVDVGGHASADGIEAPAHGSGAEGELSGLSPQSTEQPGGLC